MKRFHSPAVTATSGRENIQPSSISTRSLLWARRHQYLLACLILCALYALSADPRRAAAMIRKQQTVFWDKQTAGKLYDFFAAGTGLIRLQDPAQPKHKPGWRGLDEQQPGGPDATAQAALSLLIPNAPAVGSDSCPGTSLTSLPFSDSDTTIGANNTVTAIPGGCSTYTTVAGPDKIYTFTVVTAGSLTVLATPSGGTYDLAVYLISSCPGGTGNAIGSGCVAGADVNANNNAETFSVGNIPVGTYYLYVDSFYTTAGKSSGPYTLSVSGSAILGAGCTVTCPSNITTANDPNQCGAVVTYSAPTTSGSCGTVTCSPASGSFFPVGTTTVNCMGSGGAPAFGFQAALEAASGCSFTVTVNDTQPPQTPTCPGNITTPNDANQCGAVVSYAPPSAGDNCPGTTVTCSPPSGSFFPAGTTSVTCTAADASVNSPDSSCGFTVTVNDTQPPTVICPANVTTPNDANQCGAVVNYPAPTASDNCNSAPGLNRLAGPAPNPVTVNCSPAAGSFFPVGTTTVTCTASDASANSPDATCSFTVTVEDTQPPVITCPTSVSVPNDPNQCGAVVVYANPVITDNCPGDFTATCTPPSGSFFAVGTTAVTCTVGAGGGGGGCPTLTESSSQAITPSNSVSCNNGVGHTDNSYWRAFTLASFGVNNAFNVQSVDIGIETTSSGNNNAASRASSVSKNVRKGAAASPTAPVGAGQSITVRIYTSSQAFPAGFPGSLTLLGTATTTVSDQAGTILNVPITGTAPGGSQLVVEVFTPDGEATGNLFFMGSNSAPQTAPSYISAAECGITTPTTTTAIGFPDMHIVMNVHGCEQASAPPPSCSFNVTVTNAAPVLSYGSSQTVIAGQGATINPVTGPTDTNLDSLVLLSVTPSGGSFSLNTTTGVVTVGPTTPVGSYIVTVRATDKCGVTTDATFTVNVVCPVITLAGNLANGVQSTAYSQSVAASPAGSYTYALTTNVLPPGLSLNTATGAITGTPTAPGNYAFNITATFGGFVCTKTQSYNLLITGTCAAITVSPASLPSGTLGGAYSEASVSATGGVAPHTFAITQGALPGGLALNTTSGAITGAPTAVGTFSFRVTATAVGGCTGSRQYVVSVACTVPTFSPAEAALPNGAKGVAYNLVLTATPAASYTFSIQLGQLPLGYTMNSAGVISGITNQSGTWTFTVKALTGSCQGTKQYTLTIPSTAAAAALAQLNDYDGDGKSDLALHGANGEWRIQRSSDQKTQTQFWGAAGDEPLGGDYDGDGITDLAVFRPSNGTWYVKRSSDGGTLTKAWGLSTDVPVPGDYDGDGKTDIAVWRGAEGDWYIWRSSDQQAELANWGLSLTPFSDVPVAGDYDGDGKTDLGVFRRASGVWYVRQSSNANLVVKRWGVGTDVPVVQDYDGDGKVDFAVWRGSNGTWYIQNSTNGAARTQAWGAGFAPYNDQAVPGDYDGDRQADLAVWRASDATWYLSLSGSEKASTTQVVRLGESSDKPVAANRY